MLQSVLDHWKTQITLIFKRIHSNLVLRSPQQYSHFNITVTMAQSQISMAVKDRTLVSLIRSPHYSGNFVAVPKVILIVRFKGTGIVSHE